MNIARVVSLMIGWLVVAGVQAQAFPAKPIRFMVPYAPGGVADITARLLAVKLSERLGQQILIENRPSAGLVVASEIVARSEPDGHTWLLSGNGSALSVSMFAKLPYDVLTDFVHVTTMGTFDLAILVAGDSKLATTADLLAYARANPGKLNIGTISIGSTQHLAAELFKSMANIDAQTVPFKASGAVVTALRGGEVQAMVEILAPVIAQIRAGALRAVAVTNDQRFAGLPSVPTLAESGVPGFQASSWNGISVPAKTPRAIVDRIAAEVARAVAEPDVAAKMQDLGISPRATTPEQMRALMISDIAKWKAVIERAKIERQ